MMNDDSIKQLLTIEIKTLDQLISKNLLMCSSTTIQDIAKYIVFSGGKRIRPHMLLILTKLFDYQKDDRHIRIAAALELIHTATLLHDDIIDNSSLRRNQPSAHLKWGERNSIIAGDWLLSLAFKFVVSCENIQLTQVICQMTNAMARGELAQLAFKNSNLKNKIKNKLNKADYYEVIKAKTGVLFAAATELAAVLSEQSEDIIVNTRDFGMHLGLAFQIKDDLLDYTSNAKNFGKNVGDDLAEGKMTLPLIYLQERAPKAFKDAIKIVHQCDQASEGFQSGFEQIKYLLDKFDCIKDAYAQALIERDKALDNLAKLPQNHYSKCLHDIALESVARSY